MQDATDEITIASPSAENPSDSFAATYLSYLLARASHLVASGFHQKLKTWKLSVPEYRVLACLTGAEGLGVSDLAAMAIMGQSRMTKILDRMERQGLVERRADTRDRRRVLIHLTADGRARAVPMLKAAKEHETAMLAPLTPEERAMILKALDLLIRECAERTRR
ncbi:MULTISPECIES: MarR family winged helix-turn-helix transcriptional regulator [unclassified Chelatococcus]|uniref:MarR family winged helix-turn-helix transcriptional regulator n=1 Tax=unclassified Chelatococcus TaxID=2638111 RepID=UPI001BD000B5|nr:MULTISPECIES: MarR family winged helix-turn-helix transcriptional regulator [unclassified Chelatococcus]MBS7699588.1 winged helix-turn-helix transcriptional regulator [Chelatococcus sp. YT9]MBX3557212.1 winged helix-turn-helix transcriptional regulator [Chelatococcus sp.]